MYHLRVRESAREPEKKLKRRNEKYRTRTNFNQIPRLRARGFCIYSVAKSHFPDVAQHRFSTFGWGKRTHRYNNVGNKSQHNQNIFRAKHMISSTIDFESQPKHWAKCFFLFSHIENRVWNRLVCVRAYSNQNSSRTNDRCQFADHACVACKHKCFSHATLTVFISHSMWITSGSSNWLIHHLNAIRTKKKVNRMKPMRMLEHFVRILWNQMIKYERFSSWAFSTQIRLTMWTNPNECKKETDFDRCVCLF